MRRGERGHGPAALDWPRLRVFPDFQFGALACWRWECSMCWPPARGAWFGVDAYQKVLNISIPRHLRVRDCHHQWAKSARARTERP